MLILKIMKILLGFIAALLLIVGTAATTVNVMTVKPAKPISTAYFIEENTETVQKIRYYLQRGYIIKTVAANGDYHKSYFVVMEKY